MGDNSEGGEGPMNTLYRCEKCGREFWAFGQSEVLPCLICRGIAKRVPCLITISWVTA
jgi:DNA-directed RNA polymerase subunit RPC12/RpoP